MLITRSVGQNQSAETSSWVATAQSWIERHVVNSSMSSVVPSNSRRAEHFSALFDIISRMTDLPPSNDFHLHSETAKRVRNLLAALRNSFDIDPPKLLPHTSDVLALTWDHGDIKSIVIIGPDEFDRLDIDRRLNLQWPIDIASEEATAFPQIIETLGIMSRSQSI